MLSSKNGLVILAALAFVGCSRQSKLLMTDTNRTVSSELPRIAVQVPENPVLATDCVTAQINTVNSLAIETVFATLVMVRISSTVPILFYESIENCSANTGAESAYAKDVVIPSGTSYKAVIFRASVNASLSFHALVNGAIQQEVIRTIAVVTPATQQTLPSVASHVGAWSPFANWQSVMVADFDGDGREDVAGREGGNWWVSRMTATGMATSLWGAFSPTVTWTHVMAGDFNGDGRKDIVGFSGGQWWVGFSDRNALRFNNLLWATMPFSTNPQSALVGDFDNNEVDDIAMYIGGEWWVVAGVQNGAPEVRKWANWNSGAIWSAFLVGDFDRDGASDIAGYTDSHWWVGYSSRNTSNQFVFDLRGGFYLATGYAAVPKYAKVGDFDGDGYSDILTMNNGVWFVTRTNSAGVVANYSFGNWPDQNWSSIAIGDFNGDGKSDIMGFSINRWYAGITQPSGTAITPVVFGTWSNAVTWRFPLVGKFSGDTKSDVLGFTYNSWWLGQSQL